MSAIRPANRFLLGELLFPWLGLAAVFAALTIQLHLVWITAMIWQETGVDKLYQPTQSGLEGLAFGLAVVGLLLLRSTGTREDMPRARTFHLGYLTLVLLFFLAYATVPGVIAAQSSHSLREWWTNVNLATPMIGLLPALLVFGPNIIWFPFWKASAGEKRRKP